MARVKYLDQSDLAPEDQELLARSANFFRAFVHSPEAYRSFGQLGGWIRNTSTLDSRLREMAILQVGYLARSAYEWSHHVKIGQEFGVAKADIQAIATESEGGESDLAPLDRTVLRAAREITEDLRVSDETFAALTQALSNEHLVDLILTISYYNSVVRFLASFDIDVEPSYQPYLDEFPLPPWQRTEGI